MHHDSSHHREVCKLIVQRRKGRKIGLFVMRQDLLPHREGLKVLGYDFQPERRGCILSARHLDAPLPPGQAAALRKTTIPNGDGR